ncbi:hypothetical protein F2Q70_00040980 [Brassica cretica]|uniref:RNase H type-1 domain-containing protein n=1 Tax=Brassica cretica TaxID=69181 RepID=A0A8S9KDN9_BRACR|nr:hypothetical protein F2Q70_00040980 [Brassica cretica]
MTDTIICHTDAAQNIEHKLAGLAWIFSKPDSTEISRGYSLQTDVSSPLMAEVLSSCTHPLTITNVSSSAQIPKG